MRLNDITSLFDVHFQVNFRHLFGSLFNDIGNFIRAFTGPIFEVKVTKKDLNILAIKLIGFYEFAQINLEKVTSYIDSVTKPTLKIVKELVYELQESMHRGKYDPSF